MTLKELEIIGPLVAELKRIADARETAVRQKAKDQAIELNRIAAIERHTLALEEANRLARGN